MTASIAPQVARELLALVDASDRTDRALDRIAADHGLTLAELRTLVSRRGTPLVRRVAAPADEVPDVPTKACTKCTQVKPLTEFFTNKETRDGHASWCRSCNNGNRRPTPSRLIRNRARGRAMFTLAQRHAAEFEQLLEEETTKAWAEHERVAAEAAAMGNTDAEVARLKTGPKRREQTDVVERLDVARCPKCHEHHDAGHRCANCADAEAAAS